jgi:hypothetical protein
LDGQNVVISLLRMLAAAAVASALPTADFSAATPPVARAPYGITDYRAPQAWLRMPHTVAGRIPQLLSQTGAFTELRTMTPAPGLIPYDLIVPFWSDGAAKVRYMALPGDAAAGTGRPGGRVWRRLQVAAG